MHYSLLGSVPWILPSSGHSVSEVYRPTAIQEMRAASKFRSAVVKSGRNSDNRFAVRLFASQRLMSDHSAGQLQNSYEMHK